MDGAIPSLAGLGGPLLVAVVLGAVWVALNRVYARYGLR
jgi:hypothetical protein